MKWIRLNGNIVDTVWLCRPQSLDGFLEVADDIEVYGGWVRLQDGTFINPDPPDLSDAENFTDGFGGSVI